MKKQLLFASIASLSIFGGQAQEISMDHCLKLLWLHQTDTEQSWADNNTRRQATVVDGKFYIQNAKDGKAEIWGENGKEGEIPTGFGTNITCDDANHLLVRVDKFPDKINFQDGDYHFRIIDLATKKTTDLSFAGISGKRVDALGHIAGDMMSEDGAYVYPVAQGASQINEFHIAKGAIDFYFGQTFPENFDELHIWEQFSTLSVMHTYKFMPDEAVLQNPSSAKTGTGTGYDGNGKEVTLSPNSVYHLAINSDGVYECKGFYTMPNHNSCSGYDVFEVDGNRFIAYTSGSNNSDGFSIAKAKLKQTALLEDTDKEVRIATRYAQADKDYNFIWRNVFYSSNIFAEAAPTKNHAYIYHYNTGNFVAKYELDLSEYLAGVETTISDVEDFAVESSNGKIFVTGNVEAPLTVYNTTGAIVGQGTKEVAVAPGIYIAKVGTKSVKIAVR